MKVLHIISSLKVGGAESLLTQLVPGLQQKGVENFVIYFHEGPNAERLKKQGIVIYNVSGWIYRYDPMFFVRLFRLIKKIGPTYINSHLWLANVISACFGWLLKIPVITTVHLISTAEKKGSVSKFRYIVDKFVLRLSKKFVLVSFSMESKFKSLYPFIPTKKISVIPNGIDSELVFQSGVKDSILHGFNKGSSFTFGSVGRLITRKNFASLIKVFDAVTKLHPACKLIIVGSGPEKQSLLYLVSSLDLQDKVQIVSDSSAYKYYTLMDCYISLSYEEGLSIAILEAMSFSLPVIQSGITNVKTSNGFVVTCENQAIEVMCKLINDKVLLKEMASESKAQALEKFSISAMVNSYYNSYN